MKSESLWYKPNKSSNSMVIKWPFLKQKKNLCIVEFFLVCFSGFFRDYNCQE